MSIKSSRRQAINDMIKNGEIKESDMTTSLNMENKQSFQILLVKPEKISHIPWQSSKYLDILFNLSIYQPIKTDPGNFLLKIAESLETDKKMHSDVITSVICESPTYLYEMICINYAEYEIPDTEENEFGTLINTRGKKVYGNLLITKTLIKETTISMKFVNMEMEDLYKLFKSRAEHKGVVYEDGELKEYIWKGDKTNFKNVLDDIFDGEKPKHIELPFLLHNINIYYRSLNKEKYDKYILGKLVKVPIYQCFIMTYLTDDLFGNITLKEVKDIIFLSNFLEEYKPDKELLKEEFDEFNRKIIKNKYRILNQTVEKYSQEKKKNLINI
jgi:hypothetical protein